MGIGTVILTALIGGVLGAVVIYIVILTIKKLKELIRERLERKQKSKVVFGKTKKILDEHARAILENAPSMTMEDLESVCNESPYFIVDYDPNTDEVSDYTVIQAEEVEEKVETLISENGGIILFD